MDYITTEEFSKKYNIELRTVQRMCKKGEINGAKKNCGIWMIPDSSSPYDSIKTIVKISEAFSAFEYGNINEYTSILNKIPSERTDLENAYFYAVKSYSEFPKIDKMAEYWEISKNYLGDSPAISELSLTMGGHLSLSVFMYKKGMADEICDMICKFLPCFESLNGKNSGLDLHYKAELAFQRGDIKQAELYAYKGIFGDYNDPDTTLGFAYIIAHIAFYRDDMARWKEALEIMDSVAENHKSERVQISVDIAKSELLLAASYPKDIPQWLKRTGFAGKKLTAAQTTNAHYIHLSYLWENHEFAKAIALGEKLEKFIAENKTADYSCLYLYMILALSYSKFDMYNQCESYLKKALKIAKCDGLYLPFAEYSPLFSRDICREYLKKHEPEIYRKVTEIQAQYVKGHEHISVSLKEADLTEQLTEREKEIAKMVALGLSNKEIAQSLYISQSTVNYHLQNIFNKLNVKKRTALIGLFNHNYGD